jgi:hypothetical protein
MTAADNSVEITDLYDPDGLPAPEIPEIPEPPRATAFPQLIQVKLLGIASPEKFLNLR